MIEKLKQKYQCPIGYSDHSKGLHIHVAAVAVGAKVIEKHLSFNKRDKRSFDNAGSCIPEDLIQLVDQTREVEKAIRPNIINRNKFIKKARNMGQSKHSSLKKYKKR